MDMTISANDLKVKGVTLIDSVVDENQSAIITVRGVEKYVVLKISEVAEELVLLVPLKKHISVL